jgi:hypothetical protein
VDTLITILGTGAVLILFSFLSVLYGTDTRFGFTVRSLGPTYR